MCIDSENVVSKKKIKYSTVKKLTSTCLGRITVNINI